MCDSKKASCPRPLAGGFFLPRDQALGWGITGYTRPMLWIKALHIVLIASWFAGLFYLPRIYVNLAMVPADSVAERDRLLLMARKLYRFMTILAVPALALGLWLWL
jgi:putative membrane protein